MTKAGDPDSRAGSRLIGGAALLGFVLGAVALLMLAAGPLGWRAGWWHYRIGLQTLMPAAGYTGIAGIALSALALVLGGRAIKARGVALALLGLLAGGTATYYPWQWNQLRGAYATVNDVTTDIDNPPSLAWAEDMRKAEDGNPVAYGGARLSDVQKTTYPDIAPAFFDLTPAQAFERALAIVRRAGWTIVREDRTAGVINADAHSRWFGFTDDIAIRITPAEDGSRVDIRSSARHGRGDFGVNAARVRDFLAALRAQPIR